ncbi:MAG: cation transporter dimerization domain-containing protein, partial [Nitrospinales bacterium]
GEILMDVHILVDPEISVSEGHNIAENVRHELMTAFENAQDVLVHVDAEDMGEEQPYGTTKEELKKLAEPIVASTNGVHGKIQMRAHYLRGKNRVEIFIQMDRRKTLEEIGEIVKDLKTRLEAVEKIDEARVYLDVDF